jgi:CheY-like chemotaxis protein
MSQNLLERILYVDDEHDIRAVARVALEMVGGFTLQLCESGQEALQQAEDFAPDLILLDVMMPGMDGPETLSALRRISALAATPVVFMTAKAQPHEVERYHTLGAVGVITKPFSPMQLPERLREIWEHRS